MIYFDNAATSWPKPQEVIREVEMTMRYRGGNPSRAGHAMAEMAGKTIFRAREVMATHFGTQPERVIFTSGATYSLNIAMRAMIGRGAHFLISDMEHNAVLRAAYALREIGAGFDFFDGMASEHNMKAEIESKLRSNTVAIVCVHSSNVISHTLPIEAIGALCRRYGLYFIVDAAQSAGHVPIDMENCGIDALCIPGHKGLLGPQGCGGLLLSERVQAVMEKGRTLIEGGSGIASEDPFMPQSLPERYEPGTQPTALIAGLAAGVKIIEKIGYEQIEKREQKVYAVLQKGLCHIPGVIVYGKEQTLGNILLFNLEGIQTDVVGREFDKRGICLRYGFHCAPLVHHKLQTGDGGALRIGIGLHNSVADAMQLLSALWDIRDKLLRYRS